MIISITGTPGSGKSEVSKRLAKKLEYDLLSVNELAEELGFIIGVDKKRGSKIVDIKALRKLKLPDNVIIEGHLSHHIKSDIVVVLRSDPKELYKRLKKRGWTNDKIRENLEAECLGIILSESLSMNKNVYEVDTTKNSISSNVGSIIEIIEGKRNKYKPKIDYLEKIIELDNIIKS